MANRKQRALTASETLAILEREEYQLEGRVISLAAELAQMRSGTVMFTPQDLSRLLMDLKPCSPQETSFSVVNQTTFAAARTLNSQGFRNPLCLNFASAKNPGGGFLTGAQAQEECLARASGLYLSQLQHQEYYDANRSCGSSMYTNHMIYSAGVPVFRDDDDQLLGKPYQVSILTSPAVNVGAVRRNESSKMAEVPTTMQERIRSVLAVACQKRHDALILGAWGCGVFGNDPKQISTWFGDALLEDARFTGAFARVVFAVLDVHPETPTLEAFKNVLQKRGCLSPDASSS